MQDIEYVDIQRLPNCSFECYYNDNVNNVGYIVRLEPGQEYDAWEEDEYDIDNWHYHVMVYDDPINTEYDVDTYNEVAHGEISLDFATFDFNDLGEEMFDEIPQEMIADINDKFNKWARDNL